MIDFFYMEEIIIKMIEIKMKNTAVTPHFSLNDYVKIRTTVIEETTQS